MAKRSKAAVVAVMGVALWGTRGAAEDTAGARPGDEAMTCEQLATELKPYVEKMKPGLAAMSGSYLELQRRGEQRAAEDAPKQAARNAAAAAASRDPTGMSQRAVGQQIEAERQAMKERATKEDQPLADKAKAQTGSVVAQAQDVQSDARFARLMELARKKNCKKPR